MDGGGHESVYCGIFIGRAAGATSAKLFAARRKGLMDLEA